MATKSKVTHEIRFGNAVYDAIQINDKKYLLLDGKRRVGEMIDNGICWKRNYGVFNLSQQSKPKNKVLIIKK